MCTVAYCNVLNVCAAGFNHPGQLIAMRAASFFELHVANKSQLAEQALHPIGGLYEVERHAEEMSDEDRW